MHSQTIDYQKKIEVRKCPVYSVINHTHNDIPKINPQQIFCTGNVHIKIQKSLAVRLRVLQKTGKVYQRALMLAQTFVVGAKEAIKFRGVSHK